MKLKGVVGAALFTSSAGDLQPRGTKSAIPIGLLVPQMTLLGMSAQLVALLLDPLVTSPGNVVEGRHGSALSLPSSSER